MLNGSVKKHIGFISFRFAGTDGVSLETDKWTEIFKAMGWNCFYLAGEYDEGYSNGNHVLEPLFQFSHPEVQEIYREAFGTTTVRHVALTEKIHTLRKKMKERLYDFCDRFQLSTLVVENALTIPLNLPLGLAITEFLSETGIKCIAHHHDFFWERKRFTINCVSDILYSAYPPNIPNVAHVVINSESRANLALRTGITATLIPNVMHFEEPAPSIDEYNKDFRKSMGIDDDTFCILQPTRVVQRKGIEHAIELVARLRPRIGKEIVLLISHASGDEGFEYEQRLREYTELLSVPTIFESDQICDKRMSKGGKKCYSLFDAYPHADMVTYPSLFEGFGNAFVEAVYFKKLLVVNNYSVYAKDIRPLGFKVVEFDNFISASTVDDVVRLINDKEQVRNMVEYNYQLGLRHFSYNIVRLRLSYIINQLWGDVFRYNGNGNGNGNGHSNGHGV